MPAPQEEAVGLHARHVLFLTADGDPGPAGDGVHGSHDQCGNPASLFIGLSALGLRSALYHLRSAVSLREGQAQYPRRHSGAPVQAAAAQREAEGKPDQAWKLRRGVSATWLL